jgi:hypothetical protein
MLGVRPQPITWLGPFSALLPYQFYIVQYFPSGYDLSALKAWIIHLTLFIEVYRRSIDQLNILSFNWCYSCLRIALLPVLTPQDISEKGYYCCRQINRTAHSRGSIASIYCTQALKFNKLNKTRNTLIQGYIR